MANNTRGFNREYLTTALSACFNFCKFTVGATGAVGTLKQGASNAVNSVTRNDVGDYTVQFNKPYPAALAFVDIRVHKPTVTDAVRDANFDPGSYSQTAGTFNFHVSDSDADNNATTIAADPIENSELHMMVVELRNEDFDR